MLVVDVVVVGVQGGTQQVGQQVGSWPRYRLGLREKRKKIRTRTPKSDGWITGKQPLNQ